MSSAELKRRKCSGVVNMSVLAQNPRQRDKRKTKKKEGAANLSTIHAKCVITIPKNVQLTHNTHAETHNELLGLIGDDDLQQITIITTSECDVLIIDNEMKGQKQRRKGDCTSQMNSVPSI